MADVGVIAGSGLYELRGIENLREISVETPFGPPSSQYRIGNLTGVEVAFLPRHGVPHHLPPHRVNYRANIDGFVSLGARVLITVGAVGGISPAMKPGTLVLLDQILDMTSGRVATFFEGPEVIHVDFTDPYCRRLRSLALNSSQATGIAVVDGGVYAATNGPRLETAAEIQALASMGADVVGMTGMPEAILARERELCLLGIAVVTNRAAGISDGKLTTKEVVTTMKQATESLRLLLEHLIPALVRDERTCPCPNALTDAAI